MLATFPWFGQILEVSVHKLVSFILALSIRGFSPQSGRPIAFVHLMGVPDGSDQEEGGARVTVAFSRAQDTRKHLLVKLISFDTFIPPTTLTLLPLPMYTPFPAMRSPPHFHVFLIFALWPMRFNLSHPLGHRCEATHLRMSNPSVILSLKTRSSSPPASH